MEIITTDEFDAWIAKLRDRQGRLRILHGIRKCEAHNTMVGDLKPVGEGVTEMRFHFGPGYRVYYTTHQELTVLLLIGGDKSTQEKDIEKAKRLAREFWKQMEEESK
ncbi:MAG: type II toxin-antitoxin system RelE/ParE family toxin [Mobiluncus sp.]|uniref:type II toxin-antitoxin system RelE/ParE family toxin n=2 Tax=Mobiluncus TaxID=2050 RepID=UPI0025834D39|nr:type II toxin-antitoxin system RelE/ParE family toxin [Mobiluncus sp.]MCI6584362.1 type II toxin-antitoxin system RelE/ParE family toxin [Mobiluncus sp.]